MRAICIATVMLLTSPIAAAQDAAPKPTKEHELLAKNVGTRTGTMKMWVQGPDVAPMEMPFKETNTSIMNGFWVETKFESGPYKGRGMSGYDPIKQKYIGTWTNNMAPHMSVMEGTYDETANEVTMVFKDYDTMTGKLTDMKSVTSNAPGKAETMTMYKKDAKSGKWVTVFVMTYDAKEK